VTSTGSYSGLNKDDSFAARSDDSRSLMLDVAPQELREMKRRHSVISDSKREFRQKKQEPQDMITFSCEMDDISRSMIQD
jgi:hypothetical protein